MYNLAKFIQGFGDAVRNGIILIDMADREQE